jgi:hypothetical protein
MINTKDGTTAFFTVDDETKTNFEIDVHFKDHQVRAVAVHYPKDGESRAGQIRNELEKRFNGLPVVLRKEFLFYPQVLSASNTNSNN